MATVAMAREKGKRFKMGKISNTIKIEQRWCAGPNRARGSIESNRKERSFSLVQSALTIHLRGANVHLKRT